MMRRVTVQATATTETHSGATHTQTTSHSASRHTQQQQTKHAWTHTILLLSLLCCCCLVAVSASFSADSVTRVQYLFVAHAGSGAVPLTADPDGAWTQLYAGSSSPGAPHVDDVPLWPLDLPFLFSFNARPFRRVFLSPNGYAAFQNDEPQCCSMVEDPSLDAPPGALIRKCFQSAASSSAPACNFNTSYSNVIAVFLADLNPGASADARVSFLSTPAVFKARWSLVPFFQRIFDNALPPPVTMQLELYASGAIVLRMIEVEDPNAGSGGSMDAGTANQAGANEQLRPWIAAALRFDTSSTPASIEQALAPLFHAPASNSSAFPELSLYVTQAASWSTSYIAGVYLARSQPADPQAVNSSTGLVGFRNDMRVEYCTASAMWAISPRQGSVDGGSQLYVTAAELSCFDGSQQAHRAECRFYPCATAAAGSSGCIPSARFRTTAAFFDPLSRSLRCLTPPAADFDAADNVAAGSLVQLRVWDVDAAVELASAAPMLFRYLSAADAASFFASVPTLANPGPNSEDLQLIRMGIYPLLCNDTADVLGSGSSGNSICARDCAGVFSGLAAIDSCGVCAGGTTGRAVDADFDCAGLCFADRSADGPSFARSAQANASYCVCENTNLTSLVHYSFTHGLALSDSVQSTLTEGGCARESNTPLSSPMSATWWYRFGLIAIALAGFGLLAANDKVQNRCTCCRCCGCCVRCCEGGSEESEDLLDDEEDEESEEAAMRRREALVAQEEEEEAAAAPFGSSAPAIAAPPPRSLPPAASPLHIRWHVEE